MFRILVASALLSLMTLIPLDASAATGTGDYVEQVYVCNPYVLILTKNNGWVFVNPADIGGTTAAGWMLSTALELLASGKQIGRFFEPSGTLVGTGCGISAVEITTLAASNTP